MSILNRAFFYFFFNMLLVPGLSLTKESSLFHMLTRLGSLKQVLQNFYNLKQADFFIILLMQQISFGFLTNLNQLGMLTSYYLSPLVFLRIHSKDLRDQLYFKQEALTSEYGYNYAISLTILAIVMIFRCPHKHSHPVRAHPGHHLLRVPVRGRLPFAAQFVQKRNRKFGKTGAQRVFESHLLLVVLSAVHLPEVRGVRKVPAGLSHGSHAGADRVRVLFVLQSVLETRVVQG